MQVEAEGYAPDVTQVVVTLKDNVFAATPTIHVTLISDELLRQAMYEMMQDDELNALDASHQIPADSDAEDGRQSLPTVE